MLRVNSYDRFCIITVELLGFLGFQGPILVTRLYMFLNCIIYYLGDYIYIDPESYLGATALPVQITLLATFTSKGLREAVLQYELSSNTTVRLSPTSPRVLP